MKRPDITVNGVWTVIFYALIGLLTFVGCLVAAFITWRVGIVQGVRIFGEWLAIAAVGGLIHHGVRLVNAKPSVWYRRVGAWMLAVPVITGAAYVAQTPLAMGIVFILAGAVAGTVYMRVREGIRARAK